MLRSRIALFCIGLVLLGVLVVVGAGIYLYQNLPELLRLHAARVLQQYGVDDIEFEGLRFSHTDANVDSLLLRGSYNNLRYQASVGNGEMHFTWRGLLTGAVDSLTLSTLDVSIVQTAAHDDPDSAILVVEEYLPQRLLARLPFQSLRINQLQASYRTLDKRSIEAHGSLNSDQRLDLRLRGSLATCAVSGQLTADRRSPELLLGLSMADEKAGIATLDAQLARSADHRWEWRVQGQALHAPLLSCLRAFENQQGLALGIPPNTDLSLHGESEITARILHPDTFNLASAPDADDAPLRQLQASVRITNRILSLDMPTLIDQLHGTVALDAKLANAQISAVLHPFQLTGNVATRRLSLPDQWRRRIGWEETVALHLEAVEPVALESRDDGSWSVSSRGSELSLGTGNTQLRLQALNLDLLTGHADPLPASMQLDASLTARLDRQALPQLHIAFTHSGSSEQSELTLHVADVTESFRADLTGTLNPTLGSGTYALDARIDDLPYAASTATPLLQHFKILEHGMMINAGKVKLATSLTSTGFELDNWSQRSQLSANNVSGNFNNYAFDNLNLTADWSGITRWKTGQPLQLSLATFNPGIAVQDIRLQVSLPTATPITRPHVRIDAFAAKVFGGELALADAPLWDFSAATNRATLTASGWQLGELVALQKKADIEAEGALEGALPITVVDGRVTIESGYLRALPPGGHIRYRANESTQALADNNSELALALELLSDFQYQLLSCEVQLDKAGTLLLGLSLEGNNPGLYEGQAVRFNINVEQNLDPLLQSLRIGDKLEQRIEDGMQ